MPRNDVVLDPRTSAWSVRASLPDALAALTPEEAGRSVLVIALADGSKGSEGSEGYDSAGGAAELLGLAGVDAAALLATHEPSRSAGSVTTVPLLPGSSAVRRVLVVGVGDGSTASWRSAGAAVGRATRAPGVVLHAVGGPAQGGALAAYVEGAVLGSWASPRWTRDGAVAGCEVPASAVVTGTGEDREVARAVARARAQLLARGLAITPSNTKNPAWLAASARAVADRDGLGVEVWDERRLRREGMGGILAVGQGSATPPRFVRLDHEPAGGGRTAPRVVLVGKGITFDTGGLQVKPTEGMLGMKTDMSGAAVVLGVLSACRELRVPVRVTGLLALAENAVGGSSYRPGDVVTHHGGRTVEIGNTDAEGRLVLADALAYADARLDPDWLVDVATLTGAARIALGRVAAPVFATSTR